MDIEVVFVQVHSFLHFFVFCLLQHIEKMVVNKRKWFAAVPKINYCVEYSIWLLLFGTPVPVVVPSNSDPAGPSEYL